MKQNSVKIFHSIMMYYVCMYIHNMYGISLQHITLSFVHFFCESQGFLDESRVAYPDPGIFVVSGFGSSLNIQIQ